MMETETVTLKIPKTLLKEAEKLALERGISLLQFLVDVLSEFVEREDSYERARKRQLDMMKQGLDLGTGEQMTWTREELHDRAL